MNLKKKIKVFTVFLCTVITYPATLPTVAVEAVLCKILMFFFLCTPVIYKYTAESKLYRCALWNVIKIKAKKGKQLIFYICSITQNVRLILQSLADDNADSNTASFMDLIRTPKMRKHTFILSYNWWVHISETTAVEIKSPAVADFIS